jgi:hypothetical protein
MEDSADFFTGDTKNGHLARAVLPHGTLDSTLDGMKNFGLSGQFVVSQ